MIPGNIKIGDLYTKKELSILFNDNNISIIREGIYHNKNFNSTLLFVDLNKEGKEKRFHFKDYFEKDIFQWDSQTTQSINSPRIENFIRKEVLVLLFCRIHKKINNKTMPFVYCGRLEYLKYDIETSKPVHIYFKSIDYVFETQNINLKEIYEWNNNILIKKSQDINIDETFIENINGLKDNDINNDHGNQESYVRIEKFKNELKKCFFNVPLKNKINLNEYQYLYENYFKYIDNIGDLEKLLENTKILIDKNLYFKLKKFSIYTERKLKIENKRTPIKLLQNKKDILSIEDEDLNDKEIEWFHKYLDIFYKLSKISSRSKKLIYKLEINSIKQLCKLIENYEEIKHLGSFGRKTIDDLEKLEVFLKNNNKNIYIDNIYQDEIIKKQIIEEWIKIYNKQNNLIKEQIIDVINDTFKNKNSLDFDELYDNLKKNVVILKINDKNEEIEYFFLCVLNCFYKKIEKPNNIYRYDILLENKIFKLLCKIEFEKLLIRTRNFLKNKYKDDKIEINYKNFLSDFLNDDPRDKKPSIFGKTGIDISNFLDNIKLIVDQIINQNINSTIINSKFLIIEILGDFDIDNETITEVENKRLNIENFFNIYFDIIFSGLYPTSKKIIKEYFDLKLTSVEKDDIKYLTKERIRQIKARILYDKKFQIYRNKIISLSKLTSIDFGLDKNIYNVFNLINSNVLIVKSINYKFYTQLYLLINTRYYLVDIIIKDSNLITNEPDFLINENLITRDNFIKLKNEIFNISKTKHYKEFNYSSLLSNKNVNTSEFEELILIILEKNKIKEEIIFKDNKLYNSRILDFADTIQKAMIFYKSTVTIKMIKSYIKEINPNIKFKDSKIISIILKKKNIFFHLGKTGRYGLINHDYEESINKGFKSIRSLITNHLRKTKSPSHINDIINILKLENNTLKQISIDRIIRETKDFKLIGQSFFILSKSKINYDKPINHSTIESIILNFIKKYNLDSEWIEYEFLESYLINKNIPLYQIRYVIQNSFYKYKLKVTEKPGMYILKDFKDMLDEPLLENIIKKKYRNSKLSIKIQIRNNIKKFIQSEYYLSILELDLQKLINYYIL